MKYSIISKKSSISQDVKNKIIEKFGLINYDETNPDICFTIGGDGTYLNAVHTYIDKLDTITFVNIRTGNLGFYSNIDIEDIDQLDDILKNHNEFVYHDLLEFNVDGVINLAVNEIAVYAVPEALKAEILVDNVKLEEFTGTGLVVSTPTGSTGLNKSLNGAIIDELLKTLQLTEIAGIKNSIYTSLGNSIILDSSREIEIKLIKNVGKILISFDNRSIDVDKFNTIKIKYSKVKVKDLKYMKKDFFERVQKSFL